MDIYVDKSTKTWPKEVIESTKYKVDKTIVVGDCSHLGPLLPFEPIRITGENGIVDRIYLNNYGLYKPHNSIVDNLTFISMLDLRVNDSIINNCRWFNCKSQCIRIRVGASRNRISNCLIKRVPPFPTHDIVAIQLSDGQCLNNVIESNVILNHTDGIQTTNRTNTDYGFAAGTIIRDNIIGFTKETIGPDGKNLLGIENCLDFKTGGTPNNPMIVENNLLFGCNGNSSNPKGYAITYKLMLSDLILRNNIFKDCLSAIFNNIQYIENDQSKGIFNPRVNLNNNILINTPAYLIGPGQVTIEV